jgi:paraquat-inducible protein B
VSKKANPTVIGAFVVTAVALLAAAVMLFGGSKFFEQRNRLVAYFPESVKGLRNGANVLFRGVRIGYVESIELQGDLESKRTVVQVVMRVFPDLYKLTRDGRPVGGLGQEPEAPSLIDAGLKAQLGVESFVTGQLVVEFDFYPDIKAEYHAKAPPYPEIPTVPNNIQQLVEKVQRFVADIQENLDIQQLSTDIQSAAEGIARLANNEDLKRAIAGLDSLVNDQAMQQLPGKLDSTLSDAQQTLEAVRRLSTDANADLDDLMADLKPAVAKLQGTLAAAELTLSAAGEQLKGDTQLAYQLNGTLSQVEAASRALKVFLDYIDRHPEALLRGKRRP